MEKLDENRVPKVWVGQEVVVETLSKGLREAMLTGVEGSPSEGRHPRPVMAHRLGRLEDVHEGGIVLSRLGPAPEAADLGPVLFYPWSSIEALRLKVAPPGPARIREGRPHDEVAEAGRRLSRRFESVDARTLREVVPIVQRRSAAGITVALSALEVHEGGRGLIGYLLSPDGPEGWDNLRRYSFPEVRVRDDQGRSYEAAAGTAPRPWGGTLRVADLLEAGAAELEVEVVRLFRGPSGRGLAEHLDGPWIFRFPLRHA